MLRLFRYLKKIFSFTTKNEVEPLLQENIQHLFESWSLEVGIPCAPSSLNLLAKDVAGNYAISGNNASCSEASYFGSLSLKPKGKLLKAYWEIGHSKTPQHGFGFVKGDLIALDFYYVEEGVRYYGQVIYRVVNDRLVGFWRENHIGEIAMEEGILKNRTV